MKRLGLILAQMSPVTRPIALAATQEAFADPEIVEVGTLEEAERWVAAHDLDRCVLVLSEPDAILVNRALDAGRIGGSRRWEVVILGRESGDGAETLPPEEWNSRTLARVLRFALQRHEMHSQNLRLRGDLQTVARRLAHDCRTPLSSVIGACEVLIEQGKNDAVAVPELAMIIKDSALELAQLVDRIGFVLRASSGADAPGPVAMGTVVASALGPLEAEIQKAKATITQPDQWPAATGVARWLEAIWWNLLKNALQHGGPAAQIRIGWEETENSHRFFVSDCGPGIAVERQGRVFVPFDQLHALSSNGLGLSVVRRLVELQSGHCGYEDPPDGGARFFFTLPRTRGTATAKSGKSLKAQ
jgi:signal transduction histidine kinase